MSDLISRQWLMECVNEGWIKFDAEKDANRFIHLVRDIAPSAQPEQIIRCTNCRFFKRNIPCTGGHYNGCELWLDDGNEIRVMTDDYCSKALPKEGKQE